MAADSGSKRLYTDPIYMLGAVGLAVILNPRGGASSSPEGGPP